LARKELCNLQLPSNDATKYVFVNLIAPGKNEEQKCYGENENKLYCRLCGLAGVATFFVFFCFFEKNQQNVNKFKPKG
jgi:hypothetical protein